MMMLCYTQTLRSRPPFADWTHGGSGRPGCQEHTGQSRPPKGCGLQAFISWSGDSLDTANSHFQCLFSDLSSDTFSPHLGHWHLPLIPCANLSPFTVFLSFHVSELGDPILTRGRKTNQLCPYQLPATHADQAHVCITHTHKHAFIFPPSLLFLFFFYPNPCPHLHQPDLSSNALPLQ